MVSRLADSGKKTMKWGALKSGLDNQCPKSKSKGCAAETKVPEWGYCLRHKGRLSLAGFRNGLCPHFQGETISNVMDGLKQLEEKFEVSGHCSTRKP